MWVYIWIVIALVAIIVEASIPGLVAIWFVPGAFVAMILAACGVSTGIQWIVFVILSAILLAFGLRFFRNFRKGKTTPTNIDALIGERCVVTEEIDNLAGRGQVKVHGMSWSARTITDGELLKPDEQAIVRAVEGVKLIVTKLDK